MERETYNSIVESIYDASIDADRWEDVSIQFKNSFNSLASGFLIQAVDGSTGGGYFEGIDDEQVEIYGQQYAPLNPWFNVPGLMKPGRVLTDRTLERLLDDKTAYLNSVMCQDWGLRQGFRHAMGGNLFERNGHYLNFTFFRSSSDGYYTDKEINTFQSLSRHLMKAVELNSYVDGIRERQTVNDALLDKLNLGIFVIGSSGRIEHINNYAHRLIARNNGLFTHQLRLKANDAYSNNLLLRAMNSGFKQKQSSTISVARSGQSALSVTIVPTTYKRSFLGFEQTAMMIFVTDPDDRDISNTEYLERRWSLTPVEAEFACNLLKGLSVNHTAEVMELTKETARWYSKQVMRKLDVNSQSELIIKLMRDISAIDRSDSI